MITAENSGAWLDLAQKLSKETLQKEVASVKPEVAVQEKAKFITAQRIKLELGVSEEFMSKLKRAQDLLSQKTKFAANFEKTFESALDEFLQKNDPLEKAKRVLGPVQVVDRTFKKKAAIPIPFQRTHLPAFLKHQVNLRDKGQCTYKNENGSRCEQRRWLQVHHKIPISHGGQNQLANLVTLCSTHHQEIYEMSK